VYAVPATAFSFYLFFTQFYFLKFATDVLLAAPAAMGLLFGAGRLWDAVSDPLVGHWSDRTRRPGGRRRPWMLAGIPLLAGSFAMVWIPPAGLSGGALVAWSALALVLFYSAYTVYSIPHLSLGVELSDDHHERTRVFGAQRMAFVVGMMVAFGAIGAVTNAEDPRRAAAVTAGGAAVVASALLLLAPLRLRERHRERAPASGSPFGSLARVLRNPHARLLLAAWLAEGFGGGVLGVLAPYVAEYVLRRPDLIAVLPAFFVVAGVAAIPVWVRLSRRFGKRPMWCLALAGNALFFAGTFFVHAGDVALLCALLAGAGASYAAGGALGQSMLADTVDWDELHTGERSEGAYAAAWGFAIKLSVGLMVAVTGVVLQLAGFQPNVEQTAAAETALRALFAGAPVLAALVSLALLWRFRLDEAAHARVLSELEARRAAGRGPGG